MSVNVALITMPFISPVRPSIGISLLKAELEASGHHCDLLYLNLNYLHHARLESYLTLSEAATRALLGEWVFAEAAFGVCDDAAYFHEMETNPELYTGATIARKDLLALREAVEPYLEDCLTSVQWAKYDVIGFSTAYEQNVASLALARRIKERWPEKKIIFGGANCEGPMGLVLLDNFSFIDAICQGEGDLAFPAYVAQIFLGREADDIPGIVTRSNRHGELHSGRATNLDALPYPNYDEYFDQFARIGLKGILKPYVLFESSRGCWWGQKSQCTFCGLNGSNIQYRSKEQQRMLAEIITLYEQYGRYTDLFSAVDNIIDYTYFEWLLPRLSELPYELQFFYETKANLTRQQLELMTKAGMTKIQPGIESLITDVLHQMRKGVTMLQNVRLLKWCRELGITPGWNIIYGLPGEGVTGYEEVAQLMVKLTHFTPPKNVGPFRLSRFSPYFEEPERYGITALSAGKMYRLIYPTLTGEDASRLAYYFEFSYADGREPAAYTREMQEAAGQWKSLHPQAEFCYVALADEVRFYDSRAGEKQIFSLTGWQAEVYQLADDICSVDKLASGLLLRGYSLKQEELEQGLAQLVLEGRMIEEAGRYLALALPIGMYVPAPEVIEQLTNLRVDV